MNGHGNENCWKLHLELHPKKDKEITQSNSSKETSGKDDNGLVPKAAFKVE